VAAPPTPAARVPVTIVPAATMTVVRWMAAPVMRVTMARMPVPMAMEDRTPLTVIPHFVTNNIMPMGSSLSFQQIL
jgi:hypothetical protein